MTILLLGADGQVGFELHRALAALGPIVATTRKGVLPGGVDCERGQWQHIGVGIDLKVARELRVRFAVGVGCDQFATAAIAATCGW